MIDIEYLTDTRGKLKGIFIPIDIWKKIFPEFPQSVEEIIENIEDYCLNKAMDEAKDTPLFSKEQALKFLSEAE